MAAWTEDFETGVSGISAARPWPAEDPGLASGRLAAPFRRDLLRGEGCYFVTRPDHRNDASVAAFRDWLIAEARSAPSGSAAAE